MTSELAHFDRSVRFFRNISFPLLIDLVRSFQFRFVNACTFQTQFSERNNKLKAKKQLQGGDMKIGKSDFLCRPLCTVRHEKIAPPPPVKF